MRRWGKRSNSWNEGLHRSRCFRWWTTVAVRSGSSASMTSTWAPARDTLSAMKSNGPVDGVEEYLAKVPEPARTTLYRVRAAIRAAAPADATEAISYGMPAFKYKGALV